MYCQSGARCMGSETIQICQTCLNNSWTTSEIIGLLLFALLLGFACNEFINRMIKKKEKK